MDKEFLALEAERLAKDPVFLEVLQRIRTSAVEDLVKTNPDDITKLIYLQCFAKVCDQFPSQLQAMVASSQERKLRTVV
jgi:hypothetical protein